MSGTSAGGKKAALTRMQHDPHAFEKMAQRRHAKSPEEESAIARKAARTRLEHDPNAFRKMREQRDKSRSRREEDHN